jgi:beta-lactamase superfamily II metal-dependent hydrolase
VLESNGEFALIDTGLSNDNKYNPQHATLVINYLTKKLKVSKLKFILITHDHYDHMGGLNEILKTIPTEAVYIKPYYSRDRDDEDALRGRRMYAELLSRYYGSSFKCNESCIKNPNQYRSALSSIKQFYNTERTGVGANKINSTLYKINAEWEGDKISLNSMSLILYNTTNLSYHTECYGINENSNSVVTYIKMGNKKALITGDLEKVNTKCYNAIYGDKYGKCSSTNCSIMNYVVKNKLGATSSKKLNIDLLDLPHHGYSSCDMTIASRDALNAKTIVIPNWLDKIKYYYGEDGPYKNSKSCRNQYFDTTYYNNSKNKIYVGTNNTVFDYSNNGYKMYINN